MSTAHDDIDDLEALFDAVAGSRIDTPPPAPVPAVNDDLHDTVVLETRFPETGGVVTEMPEMVDRVGRLTRSLHEALRELGYDKKMERAADALPDARDRLAYIASLTGSAADKTLTLIDEAKPLQESLCQESKGLSGRWQQVFDGRSDVDQFKQLAQETDEFLKRVPEKAAATQSRLLDIMMAQDFHDLTGQVIKKVVDLVSCLEDQLLGLLLDANPEVHRRYTEELNLAGPVINAEGRTDVVTSQGQVDELLEQLGF